jgi:hypothetical protein
LFRKKEDYKQIKTNNFKLMLFSSMSGDIDGVLDFNPGKEKIERTDKPDQIPDPD